MQNVILSSIPEPILQFVVFIYSHPVLAAAVVIWSLIIKGFSLWHAARNYQRYWFIALLVVNTFGLLELAYLIWFRADKDETRTPSLFNTPETPVSSTSA